MAAPRPDMVATFNVSQSDQLSEADSEDSGDIEVHRPAEDSAEQETVMSLPDQGTATWMREDIEKAIAGGMRMDTAEFEAFNRPDDDE